MGNWYKHLTDSTYQIREGFGIDKKINCLILLFILLKINRESIKTLLILKYSLEKVQRFIWCSKSDAKSLQYF